MDYRHLSIDRAVHRWFYRSIWIIFNRFGIHNEKEMKQIIDIVRELLEKKAELRDNDNLLMATIWESQSNIFNFFHRFKSGKLHSPESIRRARQKLQEEYKHLRGDLYEIRQKRQVKVKEELGYKV